MPREYLSLILKKLFSKLGKYLEKVFISEHLTSKVSIYDRNKYIILNVAIHNFIYLLV